MNTDPLFLLKISHPLVNLNTQSANTATLIRALSKVAQHALKGIEDPVNHSKTKARCAVKHPLLV